MSFIQDGPYGLIAQCDEVSTDTTSLEAIEAGDQCDAKVSISFDPTDPVGTAGKNLKRKLESLNWQMELVNDMWPGKITCIQHADVTLELNNSYIVRRSVYDAASEQAIELLGNAGYKPDDVDRFGGAIDEEAQSILTVALVVAPSLARHLEAVSPLKVRESGQLIDKAELNFGDWLRKAKFVELSKALRGEEGVISKGKREAIEREYDRRGIKPPERQPKQQVKQHTIDYSPNVTDTFGAWLSLATDEELTTQLATWVQERSNPAARERIREELDSRTDTPLAKGDKERSVEGIMDDLAAKGTKD